jgi:DNA-directed RNA polymerase specialized sigma subunit
MGLSEARISQLHARAMTHLRDVLAEEENTANEVKLAA